MSISDPKFGSAGEEIDGRDVQVASKQVQKFSSSGLPNCRLCGQPQKDMKSHLWEAHSLTLRTYVQQYPDWPIGPIEGVSGGSMLSFRERPKKFYSVKDTFGFWWDKKGSTGIDKTDIQGYEEPGPLTPEIDEGYVFNTEYTSVALLGLYLHNHVLTFGPTGCHEKGTPILMFDGSIKKVENIEIGDKLMGPDSTPRNVLSLCQGRQEMFRVSPVKGEPFVVNKDHVLSLVRTASVGEEGRSRGGKESQYIKRCEGLAAGGQIIDVTVGEWLEWSKTQKHLHKLYRVGVDFPEKEDQLFISPYFLGLLLGDGCFRYRCPSITNVDPEIREEICCLSELIGVEAREDNEITYRLVTDDGKSTKCNPLTNALRNLGLWGKLSKDKFIPQQYKTSSSEDRLELLAGILDADGSLDGTYDYISSSKQLAEDVSFVARSLGLAAYITLCEKGFKGFKGQYYRVSISGHIDKIPCRAERKKAQPRNQKKSVLRTGLQVESLGYEDEYFGFVLDGDHRYLMGDFTVTHNSGKTSLWAQVAARLNYNFMRINFDGGITRPDLVGQWIVKDKSMIFLYGVLPLGMLLPGTIVCIDEWDSISEECSFVLQRPLEENSQLLILEKGGGTEEDFSGETLITLHPENMMVATANTAGMGDDLGLYSQGTKIQNYSQINRFQLTIELDYLPPDEEQKILMKRYGPDSPLAQKGKKVLKALEAEFMVGIVNKIRQAFMKGQISGPLSTRDLINWCEKYMIWGKMERAAKYCFINRMPISDREVVRQIIKRAFEGSD